MSTSGLKHSSLLASPISDAALSAARQMISRHLTCKDQRPKIYSGLKLPGLALLGKACLAGKQPLSAFQLIDGTGGTLSSAPGCINNCSCHPLCVACCRRQP